MLIQTSLAFTLALAGSTPDAHDTLESLLRSVTSAYGGEEALKKSVVRREKGAVRSTTRAGVSGKLTRAYQAPGKVRVEIAYPGEKPEIRILNAKKGWRGDREVIGMPYEAMLLQEARLALPLNLLESRAKLALRGPVKRDGKELMSVALPLDAGKELVVEIDPGTGHILRAVASKDAVPGGARIEFATDYSDFRTVNGVLVPFKERTFAMGKHTGDTTLESVEVLPFLPENVFAP